MTLNVAEAAAAVEGGLGPSYATPEAAQRPLARSFMRQAMLDTFGQTGARMGVGWILLLVLGAVFAPFIASSLPIAVKQNGGWSSPLLRNLTPADVMLLGAFFNAILLLITRRLAFLSSLACVVWIVALLFPLTLWPSVYYDGWLPTTEKMGTRFGVIVLATFGAIDLAVLVTIPLVSRAPKSAKRAVGLVALLLIVLFSIVKVRPEQNLVYASYREKQSAGALQAVIRTIVPYSPNDYQRDDPEARNKPPSWKHWMGTEASGADVFSRMLHASRIALSIGFIATGIAVVIGVIIGGIMGYFAGAVDILGMRLIEMIEAVPRLVLLLTVCAFFGRNLYLMMAVIGMLSWSGDARFVRAEFFRLRKQDFVQAAIANGLPLRSIIFKHMLPNGITPVLVNTSFGVASAILLESTLSFLGLGLVDEPSWGQLLNQARTGFLWWIMTFPGLAIFLTVFAYNLIGESMRDALDPKLRKRD